MSERTSPVVDTTDRALLRLHFGVSDEVRETLGLLVVPSQQEKFGNQTVRAVAREVWMDTSGRQDQFTPEQERAYLEYVRTINPFTTRQFSLHSLVKFGRDKKGGLYVQMSPVINLLDAQKLSRPPFYNQVGTPVINTVVRIHHDMALPVGQTEEAGAKVRERFGMDEEGGRIENKVADRRLYINDLRVSRIQVNMLQAVRKLYSQAISDRQSLQ